MNCPFCRADDEHLMIVIDNRRPYDESGRECDRCSCLFSTDHPSEIAGFQYGDPREVQEGA